MAHDSIPLLGGADREPAYRHKPGLVRSLLVLGALVLSVFAALCVMVFVQLGDIRSLSERTQETVLPRLLEQQRSTMNIERMGRFVDVIYFSRDAQERRNTRLAAQVLAQSSAFEPDPNVGREIGEVFEAIMTLSAMRDAQDAAARNRDEVSDTFARATSVFLDVSSVYGQTAAREAVMIASELYALHEIALGLGEADTLDRVESQGRRVNAVVRSMKARLGAYEVPGVGMRSGVAFRDLMREVDVLQHAVALQRNIVLTEKQASDLWRKTKHKLEVMVDEQAADVAGTTHDRFTEIADSAGRATRLILVWLGVGGLLSLITLFLAQRYVLQPILQVTRGLHQAELQHGGVRLPEARLRELDAIRLAVERLGDVLGESARHAVALKDINLALEQEVARRERTQRMLAEAKEAAEQAARTKADFLASMSHEIRTPLNAILGMADLLVETRLSPEQHQFVEISRSSGEMLLNLINDILDFSKADAGKLILEKLPMDLHEAIQTTVKTIGFRARDKGLVMDCVVEPGVPRYVLGDQVRLRQVLVNLLGNAVKFTQEGEVILAVAHEPGSDKVLRFTVRDSGVGFDPAMLEQLLEPFTQADSSTTRKFGGTGLGLTIARRLVALMGGTLRARSLPGVGSEFSFSVEMEPVQGGQPLSTSPVLPAPVPGDAGRTVVVAESNDINRLALVDMLESMDRSPGEAHSWADVLELALDGDCSCVLLDPDLDGLGEGPGRTPLEAALAVLKGHALGEPGETDAAPACVVLMPSADLVPLCGDMVRNGLAAAVLPKPVDGKELEAVLPGAPPARPLRILLVEDIASNRALIRLYLKDTPHSLVTAEDGSQGVDLYVRDGADLVFMDMQMPVMDGFEAMRAIRDHERTRGAGPVPIVALTAHVFHEDVERCYAAGASAYLPKPVKKRHLADLVDQVARGVDLGGG